MASPVGHVLAGLTTGWLAQSLPGTTRARRAAMAGLPIACVCLAIAPDFDLLLATHRTFSHSLGATALVGLGAAAVARWRRWPVGPCTVMAAAAFGSHVLFDWLGHDSSAPVGIMALWPFSQTYFISGLDLFTDVSRRYWLPALTLRVNAIAAARELLILGPPAALAWAFRRRMRGRPGPR